MSTACHAARRSAAFAAFAACHALFLSLFSLAATTAFAATPDGTITTPGALPNDRPPSAAELAAAHALKIPRASLSSNLAGDTIVWTDAKGWRLAPGATFTDAGLSTREQRFNALALLTGARRQQDAGNPGTAISRYESVIKKFPGTALACEAHFQCGRIYHDRRQFSDAFDHLNIIIRQHPEFSRYNEVIEIQFQIATAIKDGVRPRLWGWIPWFTDNSRGLDYYEQVNRNAPHGVRSEEALFNKGLFALENEKTLDAIDAFERIIYNYPASKYVPDAYLVLAKTYEESIIGHEWDQSATRNALFYYSEFVVRHPSHERAPEAVTSVSRMRETLAKNRYDLGMFYYEHRNNARAAAVFFNEAINAAPASKTARDARTRIADINAGKLAARGAMDWFFGRYPVTRDAGYIDPSSHDDLDKMGFQGATAPSAAPATAPVPANSEKTPK
jgi:outer membrane protein assembly factor BamD